jgi:carbon-monoxide dehydrogenase medium subunit
MASALTAITGACSPAAATAASTLRTARTQPGRRRATPVRATATEAALNNAQARASAVDEAAGLAAEGTRPASDLSGQVGYRQHLARVLTRRAVMAAAGM